MKGRNTLKLNTETMFEAAQMWVDSEFTFEPKPKVVNVRQIMPMGYGDTATPGYYEIEVDAGGIAVAETPAPYVPAAKAIG